jgi:hypothetical protein
MVVHGRYTSHESGKAFDLHFPIPGHRWSSSRHTNVTKYFVPYMKKYENKLHGIHDLKLKVVNCFAYLS